VISPAWADLGAVIIPDPPARSAAPHVSPGQFGPSWDLDGTYLWLGPMGTATHVDTDWDSTIGGQAAVTRVRERNALAAVGGAFGASLWTERRGGRLWLDVIAATRIGGWMVGASAGPILELHSTQHPRVGGTVAVWGFVGITPFARVGAVDELGWFGELGVCIALPVLKR
jgi:hypothetical protein